MYTLLRIFDKLDITGYVTLQVATVAVYIGANTVQKVKAPAPGGDPAND